MIKHCQHVQWRRAGSEMNYFWRREDDILYERNNADAPFFMVKQKLVETYVSHLIDTERMKGAMKTYRLAVIPGDRIGPEVIPESIQTLTDLASLHGGF